MSSPPHDRDYGRLIKLVALLDSPVEGERIAALEAVNRHLGAMGVRWRDLAAELPGSTAADHVALAAELVRAGRSLLSIWEVNFLIGIAAVGRLSERQQRTLTGIRRKVELAGMTAKGTA